MVSPAAYSRIGEVAKTLLWQLKDSGEMKHEDLIALKDELDPIIAKAFQEEDSIRTKWKVWSVLKFCLMLFPTADWMSWEEGFYFEWRSKETQWEN